MNRQVPPTANAGTLDLFTGKPVREADLIEAAENQALGSHEIKRQFDSGVVREDHLRSYLRQYRDFLIARAAGEQQRWKSAANRVAKPREFAFKGSRSPIVRFGVLATISGLLCVSAVAVGSVQLTGGYVVALFRHSLSSWRQPGLVTIAVASLLLILAVGLGALNNYRVLQYRIRQYGSAEEEARQQYQTVLTEVMLGELRNQINNALKIYQSYGCTLRIKDAPGLTEVYNDEYWVENVAAQQLQQLLQEMSTGGAIGLAGPRGVGKTSLIRTKCPEEIHASRQSADLALFISAPVEYAPREFVLHLLATLCRAYLRFREAPEIAAAVVPIPLIPASARVRGDSASAGGATNDEYGSFGTDLVSRAQRYLSEIRYLQTYTTTLNGNVKFPGFVGASGQTAAAAAQQSRSYPELVSEFCTFLKMIAQEVHNSGKSSGHVYIGIDDLDKITDGEQAQRFINELKAVLGIPYCYYLIAISENALAAYEMRGLPMRDAFDSAFDEVIPMRHLRLEGSRKLLSKRVIGMSEPFVCLCQCLSGGLPRDLIRVARHVIAEGRRGKRDSDKLSEICCRLVAGELARKLDATGIKWAGRRLPELQSELLYGIQQIIDPMPDVDALREGVQRLLRILAESDRLNTGQDDSVATIELAGYLYYQLTLLDVFTQDLSQKQIIEGVTGQSSPAGSFDRICFARQAIATDSRRAWLTIDAFRKDWKFQEFSYPGTRVGGSTIITAPGFPEWRNHLFGTII